MITYAAFALAAAAARGLRRSMATFKRTGGAHPVSFLRASLMAKRIVTAASLRDIPAGRIVTTAGVVLVRQRPGTASGVIFASLEDETGLANGIVWPKVFEANRSVVLGSRHVQD